MIVFCKTSLLIGRAPLFDHSGHNLVQSKQLSFKCLPAHESQSLPLLPSGPDGVHQLLIATDWNFNTVWSGQITRQWPGNSINPAIADCRLQGTANSPSSTAFKVSSNLKNKSPKKSKLLWSRPGSNRRPLHCERSALPTELRPHSRRESNQFILYYKRCTVPWLHR